VRLAVAQGVSLGAIGAPGFLARYNGFVGAKPSAANQYLRNPATRERTVAKSVATSSAIEGIRAPFKRKAGGLYSISGRIRRKKA
jgi:hypothetical protein